MKFILGKKIGMTQVFSPNGEVVPVTKVSAGPCYIVQVKDGIKDNATAVQIGFGETKAFRLTKPELGHLENLPALRWLRDFGIEKVDGVTKGDVIKVDTFSEGDKVTVVGESKGKGFAGVVKRHHFAGGPASHGHKDNLRAPGAIGSGGVQRVFKGLRMAGRMGGDQVTVKNLAIVKVDLENNEIYLKGAVPGGRNSFLMITANGELKINKPTAPVAETAPVETPAAVVEEVAPVVEAAPVETQVEAQN